MSNEQQQVQFWERLIDADQGGEVAGWLLFDALRRAAAAAYKQQPKEDHPNAGFLEPRQPPPPANKPASPPVNASSRVTVLALRAPNAPNLDLAPDCSNNRTPSTAAARPVQAKKPRRSPIARRVGKEGSQDHTRARSVVQKPLQPSTSQPDQAPAPQNSFKTVMVLSAPPHLAGKMMKRPSTSTESASQGKKRPAPM
jgi:hypothetical protein